MWAIHLKWSSHVLYYQVPMPQEVIFAFLFSGSRNNTKSQWIDIQLSRTLPIAAA